MAYRFLVLILSPTAWWGRTAVQGLEKIPEHGPVLVLVNHDTLWDGIVAGLAIDKRRQVRFLGKIEVFRWPVIGRLLAAAGQIPIERGAGDTQALVHAVEALRAGQLICIFPEGTLSRGEHLRARTGASRLAQAVPEARVVLCAVDGATDYVRFPRRPRVEVELFSPAGGQPKPGEDAGELASRLLAEIRERVPPRPAGRGGERETA